MLHAIADALLGAAALGDLGSLFPAGPRTPAGVDSGALLDDVGDGSHGVAVTVVPYAAEAFFVGGVAASVRAASICRSSVCLPAPAGPSTKRL